MSHSKFNESFRSHLESLALRRFFYSPAFQIYGGVAGLYDLGPPGCALKANMESIWRQHFIITENMFEIQATCLTPEPVLKASGHVDRFTDLMVRNEQNPSELYRADKLLKEECFNRLNDAVYAAKVSGKFSVSREQLTTWELNADGMSAAQIDEALAQLGLKEKLTLSFPYPFNLMFKTTIGPQGNTTAYLRPETAQGMFVNFRRLLEQNGGKIPFACAQIGLGFRNEIAPRQGLFRVREFPMAEIEHFVHPKKKDHVRFGLVKATKIPLFSRECQAATDGEPIVDLTLEQAVEQGIVNNQTLAYFIARVYMYLVKVGLNPELIRFRQHQATEMAHYAADCWDAEAYTSYGWIEIVGIADRSAYDLTVHTKASKVELVAQERYEEPVEVELVEAKVEKKLLGPAFKKEATVVEELLERLTDCEKMEAEKELEKTGKFVLEGKYEVKREMVKFGKVKKIMHTETYTPSVIEPAFGMGRVLYSILEHSFKSRDIEGQEQRNYLALPAIVAPFKVSVLPISAGNPPIDALIAEIAMKCGDRGVSFKVDDSGTSIGKRYARTDEIGIPFGITVDFQSVNDRTVTLRERDSMEQVRISIDQVVAVVEELAAGRYGWEHVTEKFPKFDAQQTTTTN